MLSRGFLRLPSSALSCFAPFSSILPSCYWFPNGKCLDQSCSLLLRDIKLTTSEKCLLYPLTSAEPGALVSQTMPALRMLLFHFCSGSSPSSILENEWLFLQPWKILVSWILAVLRKLCCSFTMLYQKLIKKSGILLAQRHLRVILSITQKMHVTFSLLAVPLVS